MKRISRFTNHFYFNIHRMKCTALGIDPALIRRVQFAIKVVLTFVISGLIAYGTGLHHQFDQQYVICVISILSVQETVGFTFSSNIQTIVWIVPLSVILFLIHISGLTYNNYAVTEVFLLLLTLIIAYQCTQIQTRKVALVYNAIFFSTLVNEKKLPGVFVFLLLEAFLIGIAIALCTSICICPFLATWDIENRFKYCLSNGQRMYYLIIKAFLSKDPMATKIALSRSATIDKQIRQTMAMIPIRIAESKYEPTRILQKLAQRKETSLINLTVEEKANRLNSLMAHLSSLQSMAQKCNADEYHKSFIDAVSTSLVQVNVCQSSVVFSLTSTTPMSKDAFIVRVTNLRASLDLLLTSYEKFNSSLSDPENEIAPVSSSSNRLSHGFFIWHVVQLVDLINGLTTTEPRQQSSKSKTSCFRQYFQWQWPRLILALKSAIVIGTGSIFVMVPYLAKVFENGQWVLIALCMTQADTVGGALNSMKMRLIGTLLGATWSYITYLLAHDNIIGTFLLLTPWIFIFAYLRLEPEWGYTAVVASFTPILINLGRLPYGDALPAGNYALLRIEENFVGIIIAGVLAICVLPMFATDLLKENIRRSIELLKEMTGSIRQFYEASISKKQGNNESIIDLEQNVNLKFLLANQQSSLSQMISNQRLLLIPASIEPNHTWFKSGFSMTHYQLLAQQLTDLLRIFNNLDLIIREIGLDSMTITAKDSEQPIAIIRDTTLDLCQRIDECLQFWSSYFQLSQTDCYQLAHCLLPKRTKLDQISLLDHEEYLSKLYRSIERFSTHQSNVVNICIDNHRLLPSKPITIPNASLEKDLDNSKMFSIGFLAKFYSLGELGHGILSFGSSIREIFELEITDFYASF